MAEEPYEGCAPAGPFHVRVLVDRTTNPAVYLEEIGPPDFPQGFPRIVVWPFGYEAQDSATGIVVHSKDGQLEILEGDEIHVAGTWDGKDTFQICEIT